MNLTTSCDRSCGQIVKPDNLKQIDWNKYNDVETVYWNYYSFCSELDKSGRTGKMIKVYGWIHNLFHGDIDCRDFYLISDSIQIYAPNTSNTKAIRVQCFNATECDKLKRKFETFVQSKKCFVKVELALVCLEQMGCSKAVAEIFIENANDVYFE